MTTQFRTVRAVGVILCLFWNSQNLFAQGTSFTYQGRLTSSGAVANGAYDFVFSAYDAVVAGTGIAGPVTNLNVSVTNGLFTTVIDFGPGVFTGGPRWLEIAVGSNGLGSFNTLSPRQALTASPYAIYAGGVSAAGISGTITSNMLAPGAAVGNLVASGNSPVAGGGVILSSDQSATSLLSQGYNRLGGVVDLSWQSCSDPTGRGAQYPTALWTGSKMIVWGSTGPDGSIEACVGYIYDPAANTWQAINTNGAPSARTGHAVVWTGDAMVVWGGNSNDLYFNAGGRYNPTTDTWQPISTNNAPSARSSHTAIWTGTEMIVWGGNGTNGVLNSGGRYNPATDTWLPLSSTSAPAARTAHSAVWTGSAMVVWGGQLNATNYFNDGGRYNPATDTWSPVTTTGAPSPRISPAVWTGSRMVVWGGKSQAVAVPNYSYDFSVYYTYVSGDYSDGAVYNPATDTWSPMSTVNAPSSRSSQSAVWTGTEVIIWGGYQQAYGAIYWNDGRRYNPDTDTWVNVSLAGAPSARSGHLAVWTGTEMLIYSGDCYSYAPSRLMYLYMRQ